jgi:hypothetical protein
MRPAAWAIHCADSSSGPSSSAPGRSRAIQSASAGAPLHRVVLADVVAIACLLLALAVRLRAAPGG